MTKVIVPELRNSYLVVIERQVVFSSTTFLESSAFVKGRGEGVICAVLTEVSAVPSKDVPKKRNVGKPRNSTKKYQAAKKPLKVSAAA